jgi:hypothetical protein
MDDLLTTIDDHSIDRFEVLLYGSVRSR